MKVRKATTEDIKTLTHRLARNQKSWATVSHMKNDIMCGYLWLLEDENNIVASCAITPTSYSWQGVKRMTVFNKKNHGKHYAETLLRTITKEPGVEYCITPWDKNKAMIHIAEKCGFQFRYKFMEYWNCYIKNNA